MRTMPCRAPTTAPLGSRSFGRGLPARPVEATATNDGRCRRAIGRAASRAARTSQAVTSQTMDGRRTVAAGVGLLLKRREVA